MDGLQSEKNNTKEADLLDTLDKMLKSDYTDESWELTLDEFN